jgi:hypothetical protein
MTTLDEPPQTPGARDCAARLGRGPSPVGTERFAVLLSCIDGRTQQPLLNWVRRELGVSHVDVVTEPGIDAVLARGDDHAVQALLDKVCVSRLAHGAIALVVAGHHDCAANPGDAASHAADLARATTGLRQALPELPVRAVYVDSTWNVAELRQTPAGPPAAR